MKLKSDDQGHVVVQDGNPVYVHEDGKEIPFDAEMAFWQIKSLGQEAGGWRLKPEKAEKVLKAFDGIENPEAEVNS
jgi:hypothetical protein